MSKIIIFIPITFFLFNKCLPTRAYKKGQYRYPDKNGQVSDQTERTLFEIYSRIWFEWNL